MATKKDVLKDLYTKCGLSSEDVHKHKFYTIITRSGIEKIQASYGIDVRYEISNLSPDHKHCLIKAVGTMGESYTETYGESSPSNNQNAYPVAMAEKRALSRIVLKLAGLYAEGVFGEDEAPSFSKADNPKIPLSEKAFQAMLETAKSDHERVLDAMPKYELTETQEAAIMAQIQLNI
jgi:hypothetical protein|tara:strand:+ start:1641 stop:2174 length:534 start_codon:yes stop_codon:yes gene_type:complete